MSGETWRVGNYPGSRPRKGSVKNTESNSSAQAKFMTVDLDKATEACPLPVTRNDRSAVGHASAGRLAGKTARARNEKRDESEDSITRVPPAPTAPSNPEETNAVGTISGSALVERSKTPSSILRL
ncbi:uncharacterized protein BT62DRAFT_995790 [Guyanagaster necrorhizus]|uniref:Uncharacterized protein n=1 Tax=Guyanagaster necrorhizus TaxID=856835 RepID=A0A9P8ARC5_9AGAR|nr:uncharacterized protein BT62DRAFT_995790 [Guyanagaster necrorhizus MCA 3950]KAG7443722.1 hypothetical protein BT62DRAFT_995790 [Guyanagaster necrorhizus MCA 3950]